jgi:queuosine biosynthesis protein QueC
MSGGMDSLACALNAMREHGPENLISLGFNYGQRHFEQENKAATLFCKRYNITRKILNVDISQIGGSPLIDKTLKVTTDMTKQRTTVVPQRNAIFLLFAAAYAQENGCDEIIHGACAEDYEAYRDCRPVFFNLLEMAIQAGRTQPRAGSEDICSDIVLESKHDKIDVDDECDCLYVKGGTVNIPQHKLDIKISTPLIKYKKEETMSQILKKYPVDIYKYSYTCYNGGEIQCGRCPADIERQIAFYVNKVKDPLPYLKPLSNKELKAIIKN